MCWTSVDDSSRYRRSQFGDVLSSSDMSLHRKLQWGDHGNSLFWDCFTNWSIWDCCNVVAGWEAELQFLMDFTSKVSVQYSCLFGSWRNYFVSRLFIHWIRNLSFFYGAYNLFSYATDRVNYWRDNINHASKMEIFELRRFELRCYNSHITLKMSEIWSLRSLLCFMKKENSYFSSSPESSCVYTTLSDQ